jgi:hypothetical protein
LVTSALAAGTLLLAACRSEPKFMASTPTPQLSSAVAARPAAPAAARQTWSPADRLPHEGINDTVRPKEPILGPRLLERSTPEERTQVYMVPGTEPEELPVDPRLYEGDDSDARERLSQEEERILAVEGRSRGGTLGVRHQFGD